MVVVDNSDQNFVETVVTGKYSSYLENKGTSRENVGNQIPRAMRHNMSTDLFCLECKLKLPRPSGTLTVRRVHFVCTTAPMPPAHITIRQDTALQIRVTPYGGEASSGSAYSWSSAHNLSILNPCMWLIIVMTAALGVDADGKR